jgi:hypothetical protein
MKLLILKNISRTFWFLLALLTLPTIVHAVTYPFPEKTPSYYEVGDAMTVGAKIYLFQSGTDEIRKTIKVNDVLTVYRQFPPDFSVATKEVGKVRILSPVGDYYFDSEVIGGEVKAGDLAKKGIVACVVTSFKKNSASWSNEMRFTEIQRKRGEGLWN